MKDSPEKRRVDAYLDTVERIEPDIHPLDQDGSITSIAISLKRIADGFDTVRLIGAILFVAYFGFQVGSAVFR